MPRSITTAAESGNGSLLKKLIFCSCPFSKTAKSRLQQSLHQVTVIIFHRNRDRDEIHADLDHVGEFVAAAAGSIGALALRHGLNAGRRA